MSETEIAERDDDLEELRGAGPGALALLFDRYRRRLHRMVDLRLHARLRSQFDASDILQEAFLDANRDLPAYLDRPKISPFLWLRIHVGRRVSIAHRRYLGTQKRDVGLEISLEQRVIPEASSAGLALMLLGNNTSPSQVAQRAERLHRVQEALQALEPIDREILALRHIEHLSRSEAAAVLGIDPLAGAKRYFRALRRLKVVLETLPDGLEGL